MAKQTQSTVRKELTRKQLSRQARDERARRWLLYGTGIVVGLVLLVLAYGLFDQYYLAPRRPVANVGGTIIPRSAYDKRLAYRKWDYESYLLQLQQQRSLYAENKDQEFMVQFIDQQISSIQSEIMTLPSSVLSELIEEEIIRQEAERRGISLTEEEIQTALEKQFGYISKTATPTPSAVPSATPQAATPTMEPTQETGTAAPTLTVTLEIAATVTPYPTATLMSRERYEEILSNWLSSARQSANFTETDLRNIITNALLREKIASAIGDEVPTKAEQVKARHILLATREQAEAALERLKAGEDFGDLARELSTDEGSKVLGGDLGWFGKGVMLPAFEAAAFSLPVGQVSDVVETEAGFHIIQVLEHQTDRELDATALSQARSEAFDSWLAAQRASPDVKTYLK